MKLRRPLKAVRQFLRHPAAEARRACFQWFHRSRRPHDLICRVGGSRIKLRSNSVLAEPLFVGRGFEEEELRLVRRLVRPGMTAFDVGANVGLYAVLLGKAVGPAGRVFAFEPFAQTAGYLRQNLRLNGLENVQVAEVALGEREGVADFHVFPDGCDVYNSLGAARRPVERIEAELVVRVPVTTIDDFVRAAGIGRVDAIKVDVEGAEEKVIRGAAETLRANPHAVLLSELYEPSAAQCGCSTARLVSFLEQLGFHLHRLDADRVRRVEHLGEFHQGWTQYALFCRTTPEDA